MQVEGREETLKKGSSFLFRELFLLFLRNAKSCIKFQYSCYGEAGNPFVAACGEHECTCQYQCQCTEYLLNAQSAERFAFCPERSVDLGQCHKACPDGIYIRCTHPVIKTAAPTRAITAPTAKSAGISCFIRSRQIRKCLRWAFSSDIFRALSVRWLQDWCSTR